MPNRKQIIVITVLGIVALMLGCKPNANQIGNVASDPTIEPKPNPVKPKPNPVKPRTISQEDVIGTYVIKEGDDIARLVLLDNGTMEYYIFSKKSEAIKWSIVDNQIHVEHHYGNVTIYRLNPDKSIINIALIDDGKRTDYLKENQYTFIKIK